MPEKVATIVGLRGTFRIVGLALGISLITFSVQPAVGFGITCSLFGLVRLCSIALIFLVPIGKKEWA